MFWLEIAYLHAHAQNEGLIYFQGRN